MKTISYREFWKARVEMQKQLEERTGFQGINDRIWFINLCDNDIEIALNLSATGDIKTTAAKRWADCIIEAANLAKNFKYNGYKIDYSIDD